MLRNLFSYKCIDAKLYLIILQEVGFMREIKWAVLGTGVIANQMAEASIQLLTEHMKRQFNLRKNII